MIREGNFTDKFIETVNMFVYCLKYVYSHIEFCFELETYGCM